MCKTRMVIVCAVVALAWNALCHKASAQSQTAFVRVDGDNGDGDGTGWGEDAFQYLQDAIAHAADLVGGPLYDDAQVWVAATVEDNPYRPGPPGDRTASFQLRDKVELYGGFAGNEDDLSERKIYENITVLSGDLEGDDDEPGGDRLDNSFHVVTTPPPIHHHQDRRIRHPRRRGRWTRRSNIRQGRRDIRERLPHRHHQLHLHGQPGRLCRTL